MVGQNVKEKKRREGHNELYYGSPKKTGIVEPGVILVDVIFNIQRSYVVN